ncbi:IS21 family transposase [Kitasatospora sp. GP82]|uniref:Mu transposase domain-containing protein n=1 Tax=Kitasatospora sp. GP82 TaxID=3035089 RepID=UPI002475220F|nr:IS21 family transposase [Kitasatospora sp. GP82]
MGVRSPVQDEFLRFSRYCRERLRDDPHLRATVLFDEIVELGYPSGYSTFTRALRKHEVRPACEHCQHTHRQDDMSPPGPTDEEVRFDWLSFPDPPAQWGCGRHAHVLMASLTRTGRWRAVLAENDEFPQLVEATDQVLRRLGGTGGRWLFDQAPAVCRPATGKAAPAFAHVAKYYGAVIDCRVCQDDGTGMTDQGPCPIDRFWWRTVRDDTRIQAAQDSLDQLAERTDGPLPPTHNTLTGATTTATTGLLDLPATPFPARVCVIRTVTHQNLVTFRGNLYAVPPDLSGALVEVRWRLDEAYLSIAAVRGAVIARHALAPRGAGLVVTGPGLDIPLERPGRSARTSPTPCKENTMPRPLSLAAQAEADALRARVPAQNRGKPEPAAAAAHVHGTRPPIESAVLTPMTGRPTGMTRRPTGVVDADPTITAIVGTVPARDDGHTRALLASLARSADTAALHALSGTLIDLYHGRTR